jgi:hypothetical protein
MSTDDSKALAQANYRFTSAVDKFLDQGKPELSEERKSKLIHEYIRLHEGDTQPVMAKQKLQKDYLYAAFHPWID